MLMSTLGIRLGRSRKTLKPTEAALRPLWCAVENHLFGSSDFQSSKSFSSVAHDQEKSSVVDVFDNAWCDEFGRPPQFLVTEERGFLPRDDPLEVLPSEFEALESLLQRMPIKRDDGKAGLLYVGFFGHAVRDELPDYTDKIEKIEDSRLLTALFRDYTFAASAFLLEPCHLRWRATNGKDYGLGRQRLPPQLARPLVLLADKINAKPFMEYAMSYALYNWARKDPSKDLSYDNLKLVRKFDGSIAEHGFILVHVAMVAYTGQLVSCAKRVLAASRSANRQDFDAAMADMLAVNQKINQTMETMWKRSSSEGYNQFRTFIMGTYNQPMFPDGGVIYEGTEDESPRAYRGESGANDSIIPTLDNLLQITKTIPSNPLTEVLRDFRQYRPSRHNLWLSFVEAEANSVGVRAFAEQSAHSALLYLQNMDTVREFRQRHWNFTKEYIIKYSDHPVATGGSPITTWLPNQLSAVMDIMKGVIEGIDEGGLSAEEAASFQEMQKRVLAQHRVLEREVADLRAKFKQ